MAEPLEPGARERAIRAQCEAGVWKGLPKFRWSPPCAPGSTPSPATPSPSSARLDRGIAWKDIARILGGDDLDNRAAALRKRFERAKQRLEKLTIERGLIDRR